MEHPPLARAGRGPLSQARGRRSLSDRYLAEWGDPAHRINLNWARSTPQRVEAEILERPVVRDRQPVPGIVGNDQALVELSRQVLEARRRIHRVTVKYDVTLPPSDLAHHHRSKMERPSHVGRHPELTQEIGRRRRESRLDGDETPDGPRPGPSLFLHPGNDHLIAHVLVDLAPVVVDGIRRQQEDAIEKAVNGHGADTLGERGGARDVDEQKEPFLSARPVVPAHHPVAQGPPPDDPTYLEQEDHGAGDREREDDGDELRGSGPEGHMDEPGAWLDDVDEDDHRSIDERLDQECDKKRGLLHRLPQARTGSEVLQRSDG